MARLPRIVVAGEPMHIMHRGNNRQDIFKHDTDYLRFKADLRFALKHHYCQLHAYVLMTNHFHLLLTPAEPHSLAGFMQSLGRRYVGYFNFKHNRSGTLWEGRFKSSLIDSDQYLLTCYRYIEENPIRADMVTAHEEYQWSSFHSNALGKYDDLITAHPSYISLSEHDAQRQTNYLNLFENRVENKTIVRFNESMEKGEVVGTTSFHQRIKNLIGRDTTRMTHGGDRKSEDYQGL